MTQATCGGTNLRKCDDTHETLDGALVNMSLPEQKAHLLGYIAAEVYEPKVIAEYAIQRYGLSDDPTEALDWLKQGLVTDADHADMMGRHWGH